MLVWQWSGEGTGQLRARGCGRSRMGLTRERRSASVQGVGWQMSRKMRAALQYALAIGSALIASWLLLRLGL